MANKILGYLEDDLPKTINHRGHRYKLLVYGATKSMYERRAESEKKNWPANKYLIKTFKHYIRYHDPYNMNKRVGLSKDIATINALYVYSPYQYYG